MNSDYPNQDLTHIAVFNIGGFHGLYKDVPLVKKKVFKRAAIVTKKSICRSSGSNQTFST